MLKVAQVIISLSRMRKLTRTPRVSKTLTSMLIPLPQLINRSRRRGLWQSNRHLTSLIQQLWRHALIPSSWNFRGQPQLGQSLRIIHFLSQTSSSLKNATHPKSSKLNAAHQPTQVIRQTMPQEFLQTISSISIPQALTVMVGWAQVILVPITIRVPLLRLYLLLNLSTRGAQLNISNSNLNRYSVLLSVLFTSSRRQTSKQIISWLQYPVSTMLPHSSSNN